MTRILYIAAFLVGLAVIGWIGAGYVGSNPLALAVTALIGVTYLAGTWELRRYQQATSSLADALGRLSDAPAGLAGWLDQLHPALRGPVRLRIEGERVALPGPSMTPYLVGLLVLLGMLGTFLGMVATLRGTGNALASATDLQAIRASLAAPVQGLGFAFGTSVAGVATSAMLGLLSALCRRERILAAQQLDTRIATTLRGHTLAHQREETFRLMQRQAETLPLLVDRLQAMMAGMEQRNQALNDNLAAGMAAMERQHAALSERLAAGQAALDQRLASGQDALNERLGSGQQAFHDKTEAAYTGLAAAVQQTLKDSAAESARLAATALQPVIEATMAGMARETAAWRDAVALAVQQQHETVTQAVERQHDALTRATDRQHEAITEATRRQHDAITQAASQQRDAIADAVQRQLEGMSARFETAAATVSELWRETLARHGQANDALAGDLRTTLQRFADTFEQRSAGLIDGVAAKLDGATAGMSAAWTDAMSRQEHANGQLARDNQQALAAVAAAFERHSAALLEKVEGHSSAVLDKVEGHSLSLLGRADTHSASLMEKAEGHLSSLADRIEAHASALRQGLEQHSSSLLDNVQQHSGALLQAVEDAQTRQQAALESRDQQRLDAWTAKLDAIAGGLHAQWRETGEQTAARQQEICETLSRIALDITEQTQARARDTIAEIERLVQAASEAPKAAADVVAELRQKLSDSMVRDNAMLEERGRLLDTLGTLLDAVNRASTEQREAVDALVSTSADLLARVGGQFTDTLEAETAKLADAAGQVSGSVVEVASLGEAFGAAVQAFGESNEKLMAHLQRIEGALEKSLSRSDEQLAYYVAQAREAIDLSVMSQKQILEDLQQLAAQRAAAGSEAA
ncbi:DUF802 domain-containing protein [Bordetella genomosp. 11]|uniref:DUF802 domain-containing protein n=1 Tax=Bordetella genomosp. 11 TaxID=1416808 RepID=A0A261UF37_9BORD|nr:DUF802 domain-containing protein [Bordetella genomosp. 11]OZI60559.1 hypothetical protein CAL28_14230 [Bordetella genomosp. 11]